VSDTTPQQPHHTMPKTKQLPDHISIESFELDDQGGYVKRITLSVVTAHGTTLHEFKPMGPIGQGWRPWARRALARMEELGVQEEGHRVSLEGVATHGHEPYFSLKHFVNSLC
jgi:hypothetical protein